MLKFYLTRLEAAENPQEYLDTTVSKSMRDQVRDAYNEAHPENPLK